MAGTYDEENRRRLENRRRNAEFRKAEQIKRRNNYLLVLCGVIVLLIFVIVLCKSCASDNETQFTPTTTRENVAEPTQPETVTAEKNYKKTIDRVNFRKKKDLDEEHIIETLDAGTKLEVLDDSDDDWCRVRYNGKKGYVSKDYLTDED